MVVPYVHGFFWLHSQLLARNLENERVGLFHTHLVTASMPASASFPSQLPMSLLHQGSRRGQPRQPLCLQKTFTIYYYAQTAATVKNKCIVILILQISHRAVLRRMDEAVTSALMTKASKASAAPMAVSSGRSRVSKLLTTANLMPAPCPHHP